MTIAGGQVPHAQIIRASEPKVSQVGGVQVLPPHHSVKVDWRESGEERGWEKERERDRDTETERQRDRDRQRERQREGGREREK